MKKNKLERRVLGRLAAVEMPDERLEGVLGGVPTYSCAGEPTGFSGGPDCKGSTSISNDPLPK